MEVWNAEAAEMEGPADTLPVDWPVASAGLLIAMPEELVDRTVHLLENRRAQSDDHHDVGGDRAQHVADEGESSPRDRSIARQEESFLASFSTIGRSDEADGFRSERGMPK